MTPTTQEIAQTLAWCRRQRNPLNALNETILASVDRTRRLHDGSYPGQFWSRQREIAQALHDPAITTVVVPAGHSVGKSYLAGRVIIGWNLLHPASLVVSTGPSNTQIEEVLWKEVRGAFRRSVVSHLGRLTANPQKLDFGDGHHALGYSTNKAERLQGHHALGPVLVVVDEASGVEDPDVWATLTSLKPRKRLLISNPLRPSGPFYDACQRARDDPAVRLIHVPSLDSPDIDQERSERGLADRSWLEEMRAEYGEGSLVWRVRVEAQFPEDGSEDVIPRAWLEAAEKTAHQPGGPRRISIDLGLGNGGDPSVVWVRDDNGVLACEFSNRWNFEATASKAALFAQRYDVEPHRVSFDVEGIGADFGNRLAAVGIKAARPYRGGATVSNPKFFNARAMAAWSLRRRLDPGYLRHGPGGVLVSVPPFSLMKTPPEAMKRLKKELRELRYQVVTGGAIALEAAEDYALRLKHSPDFQASLCQGFAFSD